MVNRGGALIAVATGLLWLTTPAKMQTAADSPSRVELAAVVADKSEDPVRGLKESDFEVKEDGRRVEITSFKEVSAAGLDGPSDSRVVILLLDDNRVPYGATAVMQSLATLFLSFARQSDVVSVIRLTHREDNVADGGIPGALERIGTYRTGSMTVFGRNMLEDAMLTVARVARELGPLEHRRKALVCIGDRNICDPYFEVPENSLLWPSWRDAVATATQTEASVYDVSPAGLSSRVDLGGGLVDTTGGEVFVRSNDFRRAARLVWEQAGHYYLLGYASRARRRDLHTIKVSVRKSGVHVYAPRERGN